MTRDPFYLDSASFTALPVGATFAAVYPPVSWVAADAAQARWRVVTFRVDMVLYPPQSTYELGEQRARKNGGVNPHRKPTYTRMYSVVETAAISEHGAAALWQQTIAEKRAA